MVEEIKALKELLDMGAITQEEYDQKKREILERPELDAGDGRADNTAKSKCHGFVDAAAKATSWANAKAGLNLSAKSLLIIIAVLACAFIFALSRCGGSETVYEDDHFKISGFSIQQEAGEIYSARGTLALKGDVSSDLVNVEVTFYDSEGDELFDATGSALDLKKGGRAELIIPLYDGRDFLSKDEVNEIDSYEVTGISTIEGLKAEIDRLKRENGDL
ncbi:MAG: SHOCT domain-containing protein [Collinsella intestinalis]|uniref:SHOCT domain-containing protein n=1 Tax=Collinsella intestinalis TaxID=147207 RepID=A0A6N3CU81_9ACTN